MNNSDLIFQILDWNWYHEGDAPTEENKDDDYDKKYVIRLFGRTLDNRTIYVKVNKFTPYFYIELPNNWRNSSNLLLMNEVKKRVFPKFNVNGLRDYKIINDKYSLYGFTNYSKGTFLQLIFDDYDSMRAYERVFKKRILIPSISNKYQKFRLYESNIEPLIRCMHIRNLDSVGFCKINGDKYKNLPEETTCCQINIQTDWLSLDRYDSDDILPFVIASYDIECTSCDGSFPQANRDDDKIIQIGTTFSRFGETECFRQTIITLGTCSQIEGAEVIECKTEKDVLLKWTELIRNSDPDIVTGYNIFGFDFQYLKDRAKKLGIEYKFTQLSRITHEMSQWKEKKLASSALGDNTLKYFEMTGRVLIDMYKLVQKDFKLPSYKLDYVAGYFIKETIIKLTYENNTTLIHSKGVYGVRNGQYITVMYNDGITENKHMDGQKFQIININEKDKIVTVNGIIDIDVMNHNYKVFWCQAKDDISPRDIFEKQEGNANDRALIAKYCIMDCALVNKLIAKIQVVANNVAMAKVCHVPMSYLFMRGQGVKIFSLVSRNCRLKKHLIPVIRKPVKKEEEKDEIINGKKERESKEEKAEKEQEQWDKFIEYLTSKDIGKDNDEDEDDEEDGGYEGATVFTPKKGVYFVPIAVDDFSSLYPSVMICKNLSHETYVDDPKYDNLPGYIYHQITYMTTKIIENYSSAQSMARKKELFTKYDEMGCTYETLEKVIDDLTYNITYVYDKEGKMICELAISKKDFRLFKFETARFAEKEDGSKGIIPETLNDLLTSRKKYKKMMEAEKDPFKKTILECMQLAFKVTANSLYGQTGAPTSPIYLKAIAASTTATGRQMLQFAKHTIEVEYAELVSLAINKKPKTFMKRANEIFKYHPNIIQTKDHGKITVHSVKDALIPESKFIKVGCKDKDDFFKQLYDGMAEHLKGYNINPEIIYGDSVTPDTPILLKKDKNIIIKTIEEINDVWSNSVSSLIYEDDKYSNKLVSENVPYHVWTDMGWKKINKIIRHKTNKKIYEIITTKGYVKVTEDHSLLDKYGNRIKPNECQIGTELLHHFPMIYKNLNNNLSDGYLYIKNDKGTINDKEALEEYLFLKMNYKYVSIEKINDGFKLYYSNTENISNNSNKIIAINEVINNYDYVYDLETENGHFHAGVGEIIVHNTDSVFFNSNIRDNETGELIKDKKGLIMAIHLGIWSGKVINVLLPTNMAIEYEKTLWPFAILTKKRYVGNLYEEDPDKYYQKSMGIVLKRRDNAPIVKIVCGGIIDEMLNKRSAMGAIEYAKKTIKDILSGHYPIDRFIITKTLRGEYADRTRIVHAVLADRMGIRDPGNKPQSNDRIPYAYIEVEDENKIKLQGDRVEHPDYILANNLKLDYLFYITNQIMKPAIQFLELLVENPTEIIEDFIIRECNRRKGIKPIGYYLNENNNDEQVEGITLDDIDESSVKEIKKKTNKKKKVDIKNNDLSVNDSIINIDDDVIEIPLKKKLVKSKPKSKKYQISELDEPTIDENGFVCI
jgi:DNA polymerase elongation subunit (family B)